MPDGSGHQNVTPKHKQPQPLASKEAILASWIPSIFTPHSFLAHASLGELPMMSQRTYSSLLTAVASRREDIV